MINYWIIIIKQVLYPLIIPQYPYKPHASPVVIVVVVVEVIQSTIQNNIKW